MICALTEHPVPVVSEMEPACSVPTRVTVAPLPAPAVVRVTVGCAVMMMMAYATVPLIMYDHWYKVAAESAGDPLVTVKVLPVSDAVIFTPALAALSFAGA